MALLDRVQGILLKPKQSWPAIAAQPETSANILTGYVMPLAAIASICSVIGLAVFGGGFGAIHLTYGVPFLIITLITSFISGVATVYILAQVIDALAPSFGSVKNPVQAMKAAGYSHTPVFIGTILALYPLLGVIGAIVGFGYSVYQLFLGLRTTMGTPHDKAVGYTAVAIIIAIVLTLIIAFLLNLIAQPFAPKIVLPSTFSSSP